MQCTNNIPLYYHSRDLNVGAIGFPWHSSNSNGEERGHNVFISPAHVDQYTACNKEVLRQTMQYHEATFRYQVQELHRIYRRQNEITNEIRMGEIIKPNFRCEVSQEKTKQHTTSWMRGNCSDSKLFGFTSESIQQPSILVEKNFQKPAPLWRKDNNHKIHDLPCKNSVHDMRILNFDNPVNGSEAFEITNASNSEFVLGKTEDLLSFNSSSRKENLLIDLNEPIQLDEPASVFIPPSDNHEKSEVVSSDKCSFAIDLNSLPDIFLPEEDKIAGKFLKTDTTFIDLNVDVNSDEPSLPLSNTNIGADEQELKAPVSPENKEGSPPRGKSEEILELSSELDETAAESLIMLSSFGFNNNVKSAITEMAGDFLDSLCWFAEVASSVGDGLVVNKHIGTSNATDNDEDENCESLCRIVGKEKERLGRSVQLKLRKESTASMCFSKLVGTSEFRKSGSLMIKKGGKRKYLFAKQRKYLTLSFSDSVKKRRNKRSALPSWGMMKKRTARKRLVVECRL